MKKYFYVLAALTFLSLEGIMDKTAKIYIAGHNGLVGSAIIRALKSNGYTNLITRNFSELDLRNQEAVHTFFADVQPDYVFLAAAKVGGILANNNYPAQFIYDNLMIEANIIHAAWKAGVKKLLFLGSSCIYPKMCAQPIKEEYLLTGELEPTNAPYAIAKIAGIELCKSFNREYTTNFISCMPTNLYGPHDNFDLKNSHVLPALIRKIHTAHVEGQSEVVVWGTGTPRREFLYVDDLADALIFLMNTYTENEHVNVGVGYDIAIKELAELIAEIIGYQGQLVFDTTTPDGTPQKLLNVDKLAKLGWKAPTSLKEGIKKTVEWYCKHKVTTQSFNEKQREIQKALVYNITSNTSPSCINNKD